MKYTEDNHQLCWFCEKACKKCSWSKKFKPVEGWKAKPTKVYRHTIRYKDGTEKKVYQDSYDIRECPEFELLKTIIDNYGKHGFDTAEIEGVVAKYAPHLLGKTATNRKEYIMKVKLDETAYMPTRAHKTDAGLDLYSPVDAIIPGLGSRCIDTGVHVELPPNTAGFLKSKSGLNVKHGITSEGVIDVGYTGSIVVKLYNNTPFRYVVKRGDKISQLVILPIVLPNLEEVEELEETERGNGGFGSTGR